MSFSSIFIRVLIIEMLLKYFIDKYFNSNIADSLLISFTKNHLASANMFLPMIDAFVAKYLIYIIAISVISVVSTAILFFICVKDSQVSSLSKIFSLIYGFLLIMGIYSAFSDISNYKSKGKMHLFKKGNYNFNQTLIQNSKDSGDYKFINDLVAGSNITDEDLIEIISRRPQEKTLNLSKENTTQLTAKNGKIEKCEIQSGVGEILFEEKSGTCLFINESKIRGQSQIFIKDEQGERKLLLIYSL